MGLSAAAAADVTRPAVATGVASPAAAPQVNTDASATASWLGMGMIVVTRDRHPLA